MIRIVLADGSERIISNLTRRLGVEDDIAVSGVASSGEQAVQQCLQLRPDVAVIDSGLPVMSGLQVTEMLAQFVPDAGVILMSLEGENEVIRKAMLVGAREVLQKPFAGDELVTAIRRVAGFQERRRTAGASAAAAPPQNGELPPPATADHGRLFTVIAGKGGVGKTVIATNLAAALGADAGRRVALVDLSLQFGDVAALLDVKTERTIADLAANDAVADHDLVAEVLATTPGGLHVMPAPSSPELADYVTSQHLRALLEALRGTHEVVVADTTAQLGDITLEAVESADRVVLVTDYSVTSVKNARLLLTVLGVLKVPAERIVLLANQRDPLSANTLDRAQAEAFLGVRIAVEIPHDAHAVAGSVSRGVPFVIASPQSDAARAVQALAGVVSGGPATPPDTAPTRRRRSRRLLSFARD